MTDPTILAELSDACDDLERQLDKWEVRLLGGKYDAMHALVNVYAGAGGTDAQDWAEMLERMYRGWCGSRGFTWKTVERSEGEEAGLKSVTFEVGGGFAYGYLRSERARTGWCGRVRSRRTRRGRRVCGGGGDACARRRRGGGGFPEGFGPGDQYHAERARAGRT